MSDEVPSSFRSCVLVPCPRPEKVTSAEDRSRRTKTPSRPVQVSNTASWLELVRQRVSFQLNQEVQRSSEHGEGSKNYLHPVNWPCLFPSSISRTRKLRKEFCMYKVLNKVYLQKFFRDECNFSRQLNLMTVINR